MTAVVQGGCFCGAVRYTITGGLTAARSCHCSRCRKAFSGAGSAYAELASGAVLNWDNGTADLTVFETHPGWGMAFCRSCGSTLCGMFDKTVHGVTLGCVDGDPGTRIEQHIFVGSKAPWDHIGGDAPQYDEHPPEPKQTPD